MQNLITHPSKLEQDLIALHTGSPQSREWFAQSVTEILHSPVISSYIKADKISEAFISLDAKIKYIKEQQRLLANLKKQLESAKSIAKEEVANALLSLGVKKLEGLTVSSITASEATEKSVAKLEIYDERELINRGFFTIEVDKEAVEKALLSADQREEVEGLADMKIELVQKPATIRINKRKTASVDNAALAA